MPPEAPYVCFVAPNAYPVIAGDEALQLVGGAEVQQVIVAKALAERGYRVSMVCLDFGQPEEVDIEGVRIFRAYRPDEGLPVLRFVWPRMSKIWACMRRIDADIYYQRTAGTLTGVVAAFCRWAGKRSVFAVAGQPMLRHGRERWFYHFGLRNVDRICVQNPEQAEGIRETFGRESVLLPSCCRTTEASADEVRDRIVWVGTIRTLKRPQLLLDIAEAMPQYRFKMVGGPASEERDLYPVIEARARRLPNVEFVGFVPHAKVREHLRSAALLVNTSESEGFPDTFLQAWANGIPTVSFVDCGARWCGRPVGRSVGTVQEMSHGIARLMSDEIGRREEGHFCRQFVEQQLSVDAVVDKYEVMFGDLLGRNLKAEREVGWGRRGHCAASTARDDLPAHTGNA